VRYLADKVVDVLMYILIVFLIASVPSLLLPTLTLGYAFLSVAIAAAIGLVVVVYLHGRYLTKVSVETGAKPSLQALTQKEVQLGRFLEQAQQEILFLGNTLEKTSDLGDVLEHFIENGQNRTVTVLCLDPEPEPPPDPKCKTLFSMLEADFGIEKVGAGVVRSLGKFCAMRRHLEESGNRLHIKVYECLSPFALTIIDPDLETGQIWVSPHLMGADMSSRLLVTWTKIDDKDLFNGSVKSSSAPFACQLSTVGSRSSESKSSIGSRLEPLFLRFLRVSVRLIPYVDARNCGRFASHSE
jgi:hypothetical protein